MGSLQGAVHARELAWREDAVDSKATTAGRPAACVPKASKSVALYLILFTSRTLAVYITTQMIIEVGRINNQTTTHH